MKLEPDIVEDVVEEPIPGKSLDVEDGHVPVELVCASCGDEIQTSVPKKYTGKVKVECPACGKVHALRVAKEKK